MPITAADVATMVAGRLIGDPAVTVRGIAPLDRADTHHLSFLAHQRYVAWFATSRAGVVLVAPAFEATPGLPSTRIVVDRPVDAMVSLLARFHRREPRLVGVHPSAVVASSARLGHSVTIDPLAVVAEDAVIGDGCWIGAGAKVGAGSVLGRDVRDTRAPRDARDPRERDPREARDTRESREPRDSRPPRAAAHSQESAASAPAQPQPQPSRPPRRDDGGAR
jgi:hypothetical protein